MQQQAAAAFVLFCVLVCVCARPFNVPIPTKAHSGVARLFEKFNAKNDPVIPAWSAVGVSETKFDALKSSGQAARAPWPGSYWPTYADSINCRWAGAKTMSPASKYARAFLTAPEYTSAQVSAALQKFEDAISGQYGIDSVAGYGGASKCSGDYDCWGARCGRRVLVNALEQQASGYCVDGWTGICHGWSPAAVYEPEPQRAVSFNDVSFQIADLKALLSLVYTSTQSIGLGLRCDAEDSKIGKDSNGRVQDLTCRDINPGAWHVVIANMLGAGRSLVEDRTYDYQVWNQPIKGFSVKSADISFKQAHDKLKLASSVPSSSFYYNAQAAKLKDVTMVLEYVTECAASDNRPLAGQYGTQEKYEYILELDAAGSVVGGEWVPDNQRRHPDFIWAAAGKPSHLPYLELEFDDVQWLNNLTQLAGSVNVCATNNGGCDVNAVCTSTYQSQGLSLNCVCRRGYTGNGRQCVSTTPEPINACATNNGGCPLDSTCSLDASNQVQCTCGGGLYWNTDVQPSVCSDVNECAINNGGCAQVCTNTYRSFTCSCATGYYASGLTCVNIDECATVESARASCPDEHSYCVDTPGSFDCPCVNGYVRITSTAQCTLEVQPPFYNCSDPASNTCDPVTSTCIDTAPGAYYCQCKPGYMSWYDAQGKMFCVPNDPCAHNNGGCHVQATCARLSSGAVQCTCMPGLVGDGYHCYLENERPVPLNVSKCAFSVGCPAFDFANLTLGSAMREEQHVMLLFNRFTVVRTTTTAKLPLNCQFACVMPLAKGWSVDLSAATLSGSTSLLSGATLRGFVDMWLSGSTPTPPSLDLLVNNTATSPTTTPFTVHRAAAASDPQVQGTCSNDTQVILRGWMVLQLTGAVGSSFTINSMDASTGEYDWNGAGFDWQMEWKKC